MLNRPLEQTGGYFCDVRGLIATPKYRQGAYEEKQILYRDLVLISLLPLFLYSVHGLYRRERLDASFLVACASFKQTPPFLTLKAETSRLKFKEPGPYKMTLKTSTIIFEVMTVRLVPLSIPLFCARPYNTFHVSVGSSFLDTF